MMVGFLQQPFQTFSPHLDAAYVSATYGHIMYPPGWCAIFHTADGRNPAITTWDV